jgi:hypothetical protein
MTQIHLAVVYDEFCKGIHERVRTTGWEVGIAHSERLGVYNCIIRKKDSMQIGIDQVLTKHNL